MKPNKASFNALSPFEEMGAAERLWQDHKSFNKITEHFFKDLAQFKSVVRCAAGPRYIADVSPDDLRIGSNRKILTNNIIQNIDSVRIKKINDTAEIFKELSLRLSYFASNYNAVAKKAMDTLHKAHINQFGIRIASEGDFPSKLLDARPAPFFLYYQGFWNFMESPSVSVVGTRKPTAEGIKRTQKLVKNLVKDGYTVVSGLAIGIDTAAHETAIAEGGATIAVLGTPLHQQYPSQNKALRKKIAENYLVISQFPISAKTQPWFFTERNKLMSAMTEATIIVEASNTSGTKVQAKAALDQGKGRKLFILNSCFEQKDLTWPAEFAAKGAIRIKDYQEIKQHLHKAA